MGDVVNIYEGLDATQLHQVSRNAERVRSAVPPADRDERTGIVYAVAAYMLEVPLRADQIRLVFHAMAWGLEHS